MPEKPNDRKKKSKPPARATPQPRTTARARPAAMKAAAAKAPGSQQDSANAAAKLDTTQLDAPRRPTGFYVGMPELSVIISDQKPAGTTAHGPFDGFDAARAAAVDALIEAIERAELRLLAVKRATSVDALRAAGARSAPS